MKGKRNVGDSICRDAAITSPPKQLQGVASHDTPSHERGETRRKGSSERSLVQPSVFSLSIQCCGCSGGCAGRGERQRVSEFLLLSSCLSMCLSRRPAPVLVVDLRCNRRCLCLPLFSPSSPSIARSNAVPFGSWAQ